MLQLFRHGRARWKAMKRHAKRRRTGNLRWTQFQNIRSAIELVAQRFHQRSSSDEDDSQTSNLESHPASLIQPLELDPEHVQLVCSVDNEEFVQDNAIPSSPQDDFCSS